jgi:hypothetical protein
MADGLFGKCKTCTRSDNAARYAALTPEERHAEQETTKNRPGYREYRKQQLRSWRAQNARKVKCHRAVERAVRAGKLVVQPCAVCGCITSVAHHESYDAPLVVVWYCQLHHVARHKEMAMEDRKP